MCLVLHKHVIFDLREYWVLFRNISRYILVRVFTEKPGFKNVHLHPKRNKQTIHISRDIKLKDVL